MSVSAVGRELAAEVIDEVRNWLARSPGELTPHRVAAALRASGRPVGDATVLMVYEELRREIVGAGVLEPLLRLPGVTDVLVNGPDAVYVDRGSGLEETEVVLPDEAAVRRLAQRLAAGAGRRLDDASPYVDVRLGDGTRLHAVLSPLARPGTVISLRVPSRRALPLSSSVPAALMPVVSALVSRRLAFLVSGGTGSGKTTLLSSMLGLVPASERLVIVEDASELRPVHPHVVGLEARPANIEGAGLVTVQTLVRQALRMRPDRLVIGEVRGAEIVDLLASLNTGHEGGCGTLHANSALEVPARVEALALAAGLGREAAHSQLAAGLDVVLHVSRATRQVSQVAVPVRGRDGLVAMSLALSVGDDGGVVEGAGSGVLAEVLER
ncbi:TadA family conjugal transfer-associated ATPase [Nocardioides sp. Kera G14]|uniref:TadA family conjugal transfer-associated ATPase n=1 Tax=Nocardioides sp. Kera G14 TaxID=2884264 RepID=UPI001D12EE83|nr:TadA family conjugal transfer-associated ATPase [Nocardioides sp. Kera G14]UDY23804.1 TadA family conjugal transfer-associated ATPase [Nocardioides sp. Kera G14]